MFCFIQRKEKYFYVNTTTLDMQHFAHFKSEKRKKCSFYRRKTYCLSSACKKNNQQLEVKNKNKIEGSLN